MSDGNTRHGGDAGHGGVADSLALLGVHEPDPSREARLRARCHAALRRRQQRRLSAATAVSAGWPRRLEPAVVGSLCAAFLIEVLSRAIHLYRF